MSYHFVRPPEDFSSNLQVAPRCEVVWVQSEAVIRDRQGNNAFAVVAAEEAVARLLEKKTQSVPPLSASPNDERNLLWKRDSLGKPSIEFAGAMKDWAKAHGVSDQRALVSNTNDGGHHLVLAAYGGDLVGVGIDLVELERLKSPSKDIPYLERFVRHFMSEEELGAFHSERSALDSPEFANPILSRLFLENRSPLEKTRFLAAIHFSFMEAASKACGTGLKMGVGMGHSLSLPKQSLGCKLNPDKISLITTPESEARMNLLGARSYTMKVHFEDRYVVTAVAFFDS